MWGNLSVQGSSGVWGVGRLRIPLEANRLRDLQSPAIKKKQMIVSLSDYVAIFLVEPVGTGVGYIFGIGGC